MNTIIRHFTFAALSASILSAAEPATPPKTFRTPSGNDQEIALNADWMPKREQTAKEYGQGIAFYSLAALSGEEPGKETVPELERLLNVTLE